MNSVSDDNVVELVSFNACVVHGDCKHTGGLETVGAVRDLAEFFECTVGDIKPDKSLCVCACTGNCCPIEGVLKQAAALVVEVLACKCADAGFCNLSDGAGVEVYAAKCAVEVNDPEGAVGIKVHCDNAAAELTDFGTAPVLTSTVIRFAAPLIA